MRVLENGLLDGFRPAGTPNQGGRLKPELIVVHYTAGGSVDGAVKWFQTPGSGASAHVVIGDNGGVRQVLPFNVVAWHAGASNWMGRSNCNSFSIGIELVNWGPLSRTMDGKSRSWTNAPVPSGRVVRARHKHQTFDRDWHTYSDRQIESLTDVVMAIRDRYGNLPIVGHEDVSRGRKIDPGPAFPWDSFLSVVNGRRDESVPAPESGPLYVNAYRGLNLRSEPDPSDDGNILASLPMGTRVFVREHRGEWVLVRASTEFGDKIGWVFSAYLIAG